ncbi:MAG: hypothetical protein OEV35_10295 [Gallionellaceae bacterium]|nr:hypothetical protein [Gallionellaceae bacterium]
MTDLNDDRWMDALAGRVHDEHTDATGEIRLLRQALLESDQEAEPMDDEAAYRQLRARMKREGMLKGAWQQPLSRAPHEAKSGGLIPMAQWRWLAAALPVVAMLTIGTIFVQQFAMQQEPAEVRGTGLEMRGVETEGVQIVQVKDVNAALAQLKAILEHAGAKYETHVLGLKVSVEAQLPMPIDPDVYRKLRELGITPRQNGQIAVELQPAP